LRPEGDTASRSPAGNARERSLAAAQPPAKSALPAPANGASSALLPTLEWNWPVDTPIVQPYSELRKGIDFGGALGQPVRAAAAGLVSYVGDSLRGYGRMVVLKHDKGYISVYAHNRQILVKDGDHVERGQRIAEMGNSDSNDVVLHFELRHQGRPLDPSRVLPGR
jgi:lipoprotein NlpD